MPKPIRIQRSRQHKQVSPNGLAIVYIGRPSKFGNPFKMGEIVSQKYSDVFDETDLKVYLTGGKIVTREDACYLYEKYMLDEMKKHSGFLRGKKLSCWCGPDIQCHGDIILKIVNE